MTVAFITQHHPPTLCGVGDFTVKLAGAFHLLGIESHIICNADQKASLGTDGAFTLHPVVEKWDGRGFDAISERLELLRPDWVLLQYTPHGYHRKGLPLHILGLYDRFSGKNFRVFTFFHEISIRPERKLATWVACFLQKQLAKRMLRRSDAVATSSDIYGDTLKKLGAADKLILSPIGPTVRPFEPAPENLCALRARLGIADGVAVVGSFGNRDISPYLTDFDRLVAESPGMTWLICGKSATPDEVLRSRAYIRYVGPMDEAGIYAHLRLCTAYFSPDLVRPNGQGGSCNKSSALACGLSLGIPVVGVKGDMNNVLLRHGENILLADTNQPFALYDALLACISSPELAQNLGAAARLLYENHLLWDIAAIRHLELMVKKQEYAWAAPREGGSVEKKRFDVPAQTTAANGQ